MRRNLRLNWRALALLGALLLSVEPRAGLSFVVTTMSSQDTNSTQTNSSNNNSNNNNQYSSNSSIQSDHSHNSTLSLLRREYSIEHNQSISAEFNMRTLNNTNQLTAINTTTIATPSSSSSSSSSSRSSSITTEATVADADRLGFIFSSAPREHLAILSRTERSIRHQHQHLHHQQLQQRRQQQQQSQADAATNINSNSNSNSNFIGSKSKRLNNSRNNLHINSSNNNNPNNSNSNSNIFNNNPSNLDRNERSTISHLAGPSRKIQLYMKNRILQILPDGTVNGTQDEQSEYTILQRSTVDVGRIKIQSVATCLYLCMDACGAAYASKEFDDNCVFNENMELHNYNTYSSTYNSNARRVFYLALTGQGAPRRTQIPATRTLGKLSTYTNAITETVPQQRVEQLIAKNFGANRVKHGVRQLCDTGKPLIELIDAVHFKPRPKCSSSSGSGSSRSSSSSSSSSSNSSSSSSSSNVPVPAYSASSLISISNGSQSDSGHISSSINSSSSNNNNNNSSSSNSSNLSSNIIQHKKKKKLRKCRPHEQEHTHNCQRRIAPSRGPKAQACKDLRDEAARTGAPPPNCGKKSGSPAAKRKAAAVAASGGGAKGAMQRPRAGGAAGKRKAPKVGAKQRLNGPKRQRAGNASKRNNTRKLQRLLELSSTTTRTTTTTSTTMASSLATPGYSNGNSWESSSPLPALALSETSDRVERNVRMSQASVEEPQSEDDAGEEDDELPELDSQEEPENSYENATLEGQARGSAVDDSVYYDQLDLH
ncbi:myb-like protein A isoform X2 [Drosophila hydei]|uniref:Fibroblast growth factor n=1 Tax=Drosophila hydei TaxID=7224 RepID=A0A6J1MI18_DROHY|nr:myb-like protein A isoform X2 [Drosophila hydei]